VRSLQQEVGITTVYVTHDQAEAMVIADRIAVMFAGRVHQLAAPREIYYRPETAMVAEFIGLTNFIRGEISGREGELLILETALGPLRCAGRPPEAGEKSRLLTVRPEAIRASRAPGEASQNRLTGTVRAVAFLGNLVDYRVEVTAGPVLRVQGDPHAAVGVGERVHLAFDPAATWSVPPREVEAA
jgi:ABC-type Fe3+/spermidine/putrescine transport system ATPase subunit